MLGGTFPYIMIEVDLGCFLLQAKLLWLNMFQILPTMHLKRNIFSTLSLCTSRRRHHTVDATPIQYEVATVSSSSVLHIQ